ncbi:MAG: Na+ dependent nucleoside transporter, partial [Flavobacteriales bacterium]|nr:Na+ dependent nucleoside transporter [Flavobacteriales bacterium]
MSIESILRGLLGLSVLLGIAYLFSTHRKAISIKSIAIGLTLQIVLALAVLKLAPVQWLFEFVGKIFVKILDFTRDGSIFLLGDLMNAKAYGFIFAFQVLPTIIFFSALSSVLFYLGIIQKVVKGLALVFVKLMKVSGAESLSVAGNIFLG